MTAASANSEPSVVGFISRNWVWIALGIVALLWATWRGVEHIARLPVPQTIGEVGAIGFALGVWGVVLSVAGFGVTWWQLHRTQTSAAAVARALDRIKKDYGSFDVITELRTAMAWAAATQSHVGQGRWDDALASYNSVRLGLTKMIAVKGGLDVVQLEEAKNFLALTVDACRSIDQQNGGNPNALSSDVLKDQLRDLEGFLISVEYNLKDAIRG